MNITWKRWISAIAIALGLSVPGATSALAQTYVPQSQPTVVWGQPQIITTSADKGHPGDLPNGKTPQTPQTPISPKKDPTTPAQPDITAPPMTDTADTGDSGLGGSAVASSVGMQGRGDANNRFNLFDNMAAIPTSRVWAGYQYQDNFKTGVTGGGPGNTNFPLNERRIVNLYRMGVEYAINCNFSIAAQHQYIGSAGTVDNADAWGNPQFMAKYAVINDETSVLSATLGFQPQTSLSTNEIHERTTRFYPGLLFFQGVGDDLFLQGGAQFGISTNDLAQTFDYAISVGYWLYRADNLDVAGRRRQNCGYDCCCQERRLITGIIPQAEVLAKHVFANSRGQAFETTSGTGGFGEGRNAYDVTLGGRVLLGDRLSVGMGYSFPITGAFVRKNEFMTSLNFSF